MAQLQAVPPATAQEMTIADMVKQARIGVHELQDRMMHLAERSGVRIPTPEKNQAPIAMPEHLQAAAQDLLRAIASCHDTMIALDRIA